MDTTEALLHIAFDSYTSRKSSHCHTHEFWLGTPYIAAVSHLTAHPTGFTTSFPSQP